MKLEINDIENDALIVALNNDILKDLRLRKLPAARQRLRLRIALRRKLELASVNALYPRYQKYNDYRAWRLVRNKRAQALIAEASARSAKKLSSV